MTEINLELKVNNKEMLLASGVILDKWGIIWTNKSKEGIIKQSHGRYSINDVYNEILKEYNGEMFELNLRINNYLVK